jgi:isocitrate dehydrogenase (NAD+)
MPPTVTLIRGDGIGPEVVDAALRVLDSAGAEIEWEERLAGLAAIEQGKPALPEDTLESIRRTKVALKGPLTTPVGSGFRSVNVAIRKECDLFANVRPAKTMVTGLRFEDVDLVVVRENTEGLYVGVEHYIDTRKSAAESITIVTRDASARVIRYAFELARTRPARHLTLVHKANILKFTSGLFLQVGREMAGEYPDVTFDERIIDNMAMQLVVDPLQFDTIVTTNMFGDILSDLCAGLVGGLGMAPAANIGEEIAVYEAIHGSAPDIAGKGVANPTALLLAAAMLCERIGQVDAGRRVREAVERALGDGRVRTRDLGGDATTEAFTDAVLVALENEAEIARDLKMS